MAIQVRQEGRMEQGLALLPRMLQSIEVLQLTTAELLSRIEQELESNETLVAEPVAAQPELQETAAGDRDAGPDWESDEGPGERFRGEDHKQEFLQNLPDRAASLLDHIVDQLHWLDLDPRVSAGVEVLAGQLDHRGLLTADAAELAEVLDDEVFTECVAVLQSLEPRGLGAPDPISAMLLQLDAADPDFADIDAMLREHLDALARNKVPEVARALGRSVAEVQELLQRIRRLDPHPGAGFASAADERALRPDVVVRLVGEQIDDIEVEVDGMGLPDLGIATEYEQMVRDRTVDRDVQRYLNDKLRSARDLIGAVAQRQRTLARVTLAIMRHQFGFLVHGRRAVRSLGMEEVAAVVGLHPSTVSRAIAGKSVQTDHGVFRLREFFDADRGAASRTSDGTGRMAIRDQIRALVAAEDPREPLSDDDLARLLAERNVKVARRTVAKYRRELGLSSSWRRKDHNA